MFVCLSLHLKSSSVFPRILSRCFPNAFVMIPTTVPAKTAAMIVPIPTLPRLCKTARQVTAAYYGTTPQKKIEAQIIRKTLRQNLSNFKEYVREYQETEDKEEKEDIGYLLKKELRDSAAFAAFKRWLIWDNEMFSEIEQFIPEN